MFDYALKVEEVKTHEEIAPSDLKGRVFVSRLDTNYGSLMKYLFLNHDEREFEVWDAKIVVGGSPTHSLTYGIKEFQINYEVNRTRDVLRFTAFYTDVKKKTKEDGNEVHMKKTFVQTYPTEKEIYEEQDVVVMVKKGLPLHNIWDDLSDSTIMQYADCDELEPRHYLKGVLTKPY